MRKDRVGPKLQVSMFQFLKIVFSCAVACACITPSFRLVQLGDARLMDIMVADVIVVSLALSLLAFVMVGRGPRRAMLIAALMLCSALVLLVQILWLYLPVAARFTLYGRAAVTPIDLPGLAIALVGVPALVGFVAWLILRLTRARGALARSSTQTSQ